MDIQYSEARRNPPKLSGSDSGAIPKDASRDWLSGMTVVIFAVVILLLLYLFSGR